MTYRKLAVWVTVFTLMSGVGGLFLDTRFGYFSDDRGFVFFLKEGAFGLMVASDGCWRDGVVADSSPTAAHTGLFSALRFEKHSNAISLEVPGVICLLVLAILCLALFFRARLNQSYHDFMLTGKAVASGDGNDALKKQFVD